MSEKFSLKWNDYKSNWNKTINELQTDTDFADVTLISDDKVNFTAHKILLSSCSNLFKSILRGNTQSTPLLFLGGVSSINLGLILNYIYQGEVNLCQEQLDSFIECAQKLEINGLQGGNIEEKDYYDRIQDQKVEEVFFVPVVSAGENWKGDEKMDANMAKTNRRQYSIDQTDEAKLNVGNMTCNEIGEKIKELYLKNDDGNWKCLKCNYITTSIKSSQMRSHVETHLDGLCYTCDICKMDFKSRHSFYSHNSRNHK